MIHDVTKSPSQSFELLESALTVEQTASRIARLVTQVGEITIDFAQVKRLPRFCPETPESDVEHSFMLGMTALELGPTFYPGLDTGLMARFALVHDLVEIKTGDVSTFDISSEALATKKQVEHVALSTLLTELPPSTADMLAIYEEQITPEARVVRHMDKLLPYAVDIVGAGMEVMRLEGVSTVDDFMDKHNVSAARYRDMFPDEEHEPLHLAYDGLAHRFAAQFNAN